MLFFDLMLVGKARLTPRIMKTIERKNANVKVFFDLLQAVGGCKLHGGNPEKLHFILDEAGGATVQLSRH